MRVPQLKWPHYDGTAEGYRYERIEVFKSLWASVQGDPVFMRRINGWLTVFWLVMIPVSLATGWVSSVIYVSALSLWALVAGHWSAWQAARVEVRQEDDADVDDVLAVLRELRREISQLRPDANPADSATPAG